MNQKGMYNIMLRTIEKEHVIFEIAGHNLNMYFLNNSTIDFVKIKISFEFINANIK